MSDAAAGPRRVPNLPFLPQALFEPRRPLIAILVGWMVGRAVSVGSEHRGGWLYQVMAVGFTYMAISTSYIPQIVEAWGEPGVAEELSGAVLYIAGSMGRAVGGRKHYW